MENQKSLDAIEGKTNITYKTEIQKDSPCKELTLEGLKSLYLLQWGIWTKWEMNMVMNITLVNILQGFRPQKNQQLGRKWVENPQN